MADAYDAGFFRAIWYTPLRDFLRWRWTAELDWRRRVAEAELSAEIKQVVYIIVRRTRLLRNEKTDVAIELISHFSDGIDAGQSPPDLIQQFGNISKVARLIARAKRRGRPVWLRMIFSIFALVQWSVVVAVGMWLICNAAFWLGRPAIRMDYLAIVNASIERTSLSQRAWPIYRQAILEMGNASKIPGKNSGAEIDAWLGSKQHIIELIHLAASKPSLGFTLGPAGEENDPRFWPARTEKWNRSVYIEPMVGLDSLPQMDRFAQLARILQADMRAAGDAADEPRFMRDLESFLSMAAQFNNKRISDSLFSSAARVAAVDALQRVLIQHSMMLSNADLRNISLQLSGPRVAADIVSASAEQYFILDSLQRMYTDDGHGDGRMTPAGFAYLSQLNVWTRPSATSRWYWPASLFASLSRKQVWEEYKMMTQLAERNLELPAREADWRQYNHKLHEYWQASGADAGRQFLGAALEDMQRAQMFAERYLGARDGLLIGVALEKYRREHGQYPSRLTELTPRFLAAIPADRITGAPVKYKLVAGVPLVYSVGEDRIDDGGVAGMQYGTPILQAGVPYKSRPGQPGRIKGDFISPYAVAEWNIDLKNAKPGDWILFPQWKYWSAPN